MSVILAATDGSTYATSVYHYAAWAAKKLGTKVAVLHLLDPRHDEPVKADLSGTIGLGARSALMEELVELEGARARLMKKRGQAILDHAAQWLGEAGLTDVETEQRHERLSDFIESEQCKADLVVLGKRGNHADYAKGHLGSNLERVVRSCRHPVLVASVAQREMKRFVLAYDGGSSARKALEFAVANPLLRGMQCHLIHVGEGSSGFGGQMAEAEEYLRGAGFEVTAKILPGDPAAVISDVVGKSDIDLLVMGAYSSSGIRRFFVGSTTSALIRGVKIPLLLLR